MIRTPAAGAPRLVLASASPRRRELLAGLGLDFRLRPVDVDETTLPGEEARPYVLRLAEAKAAAAAAADGELALAADTVVVVDGELLGKPRDPDDARRMLRRLSGREHEVLTGVALRGPSGEPFLSQAETTRVRFAELSPEEVDWYVASGEPFDKAGAYAVQGLGALFVDAIAGNYSNVVGLPLALVYRLLRRAGYPVLAQAPAGPPDGSRDVKALLDRTAERAGRYLEGLGRRRVAPSDDALARLADLERPLPDAGWEPDAVVEFLDEVCSPATIASAGPRYFGFVTGGSLPAALAANWLAGAWDQNSFSTTSSPVAAAIEKVAGRWLLELLGLPPASRVAFVTGTTMAHVAALAAARHAVLTETGWEIEGQGLFDAPPITVIVGEEAHATLFKALGIVGLGRNRVVTVPVDGQGRMRADALPALDRPAIVCIQAGNVNTGAFDPAAEICAAARAAGAWVHVDGAFGLWAAAAPERAHLAAGVADADSWSTDAHKWLNVPYDCGVAIVRRPEALRSAMAMSASYLPDAERQPYDYTPESSRRARGVEVWAALRSLGRAGVADLVERNCRFAARFAEGLRAAGHQVLNDVVLNQVLVAFGDAETTRRVVAAVQREGTCWAGGSVWQGREVMRISVSSWATAEADVERSLEAILRVAAKG